MSAYYNEIDPYAAEWLRNLIAAGHIADGVVDERSIEDVVPAELSEFTQCHFFAGIGIWSIALRSAGWADDRPVWTGSCPCQPFSAAGKGEGFDDERHLWPAWHHLIGEQRPAVVFGEQVTSVDGLSWLDTVQSDLEGTGYACGALDHCAAGYGAPHIRQRLYVVAEWLGDAKGGGRRECGDEARSGRGGYADGSSNLSGWLDNAERARLEGRARRDQSARGRETQIGPSEQASNSRRLADANKSEWGWLSNGERGFSNGSSGGWNKSDCGAQSGGIFERLADSGSYGCNQTRGRFRAAWDDGIERNTRIFAGQSLGGATNGLWADADWLYCRDERWRPVEPFTFPLAHGATSRVGRLRAYGNGINLAQAAAFIAAYMGCRP